MPQNTVLRPCLDCKDVHVLQQTDNECGHLLSTLVCNLMLNVKPLNHCVRPSRMLCCQDAPIPSLRLSKQADCKID